tara:strand:- start:292 stop:993 length:702 start_codon:yes stop_codon:yes gene_type:complete
MMTMDQPELHSNISQVRERLSNAAKRANRSASDIRLIAVSKTKPLEAIRYAFAAGITDFGENYVAEGVEKRRLCSDLDITWHFLGPVQSNKTRHIAENFDWIHSIDRLKTASRLNAQRPVDKAPLNVCLQVNIPFEETKSGLTTASELVELASAIQQLERLSLRGIMAIPPPCADPHLQREQFKFIASLLNTDGMPNHVDELSMGMSGDMEAAIAEGSTMVRIGTDIFGARYT